VSPREASFGRSAIATIRAAFTSTAEVEAYDSCYVSGRLRRLRTVAYQLDSGQALSIGVRVAAKILSRPMPGRLADATGPAGVPAVQLSLFDSAVGRPAVVEDQWERMWKVGKAHARASNGKPGRRDRP
jgi:hypothetical protein